MFVRVKKIGPNEYLYLVENVREGGRHRPRHGLPFDTHPNTRGPASDRLVPWKVRTEREEPGQKPPGAAIWKPGPHLRQCPLVFGGAAA